MTTEWNPNKATSLGLEWFPTQWGETQITEGQAVAVTFPSTAAETIDYVVGYAGGLGGDSTLMCEVYTAGSETVTATPTTTIYRPTDDLQIGGVDSESSAWITSALTTTNLFNRIDESTLDPADWIVYWGGRNARSRYRIQFGTGAFAAGQRVVGGRIKIVADREEVNGSLEVRYYNGTNSYLLGNVTVTTKRQTLSVPFPETNPSTKLPWTRSEIQAFAALSTAAIQIRPGRSVGRNKALKVYQLWLELDTVTENRLAVGTATIDETDDSGLSPSAFYLRVPDTGVDNWAKASGTSYTIVFRRIEGPGVALYRYLEETDEVADHLDRASRNVGLSMSAYSPTFDSRGFISSMGDRLPGRAPAFLMWRTAGTGSVDGQPYYLTEYASQPYTGNGVAQTFTANASGSYSQVRFIMGAGVLVGGTTYSKPTETQIAGLPNLTLKIKNASTNATLSTQVVTAADYLAGFEPEQSVWSTLDVRILTVTLGTAAALVAGTRYYLEVTAVDTAATAGDVVWYVPFLYTVDGLSSFDGTTNDLAGTTGAVLGGMTAGADIPLQVSIRPTAPSNFLATPSTVALDAAAAGNAGCTIGSMQVALLTWTATALGAPFGWYELQRLGFDGATWETVARITNEGRVSFTDWEVRRGQTEQYRARVVRDTDYVGSAWTAVDPAVIADAGEDIVFASNHAQDALAFIRDPAYKFTFPSATEYVSLSGRDYRVALVEAEDRGDEFTVPVVVFAGTDDTPTPTVPGRMTFEPLRAFTRLDVPHFAVCDRDGWRWFGDIRLVDAEREEPAGNYRATVAVVEGQASPTPVETT